MTTTPAPVTVRLSAAAVDDHLGRLYETVISLDDTFYRHVDVEGAELRILSTAWRTCTVTLTPAALREFIADLDYQIEFSEDAAYKAQCQRARVRLRAVR